MCVQTIFFRVVSIHVCVQTIFFRVIYARVTPWPHIGPMKYETTNIPTFYVYMYIRKN